MNISATADVLLEGLSGINSQISDGRELITNAALGSMSLG